MQLPTRRILNVCCHNVCRHLAPVFVVCLLNCYPVSQVAAASIAEASVFTGHKGSFEHGGPNNEILRVENLISAAIEDLGGTSDTWGTTATSAKAATIGAPGNLNFWRLEAAVAAGAIQTDNRFSNGLDNRAQAHSSWQDEVFFSTSSSNPLPSNIRVNFRSTGFMSLAVTNESPETTQVRGSVRKAINLNGNFFTYEIAEIVRPGESSRVAVGHNIGDDALSASGDFLFRGSFDLPLSHSNVERTNASALILFASSVVSDVHIIHFPGPPPLLGAELSVLGIADFASTFLIESLTLTDGTTLEQAGIQYYFGGSLLVPEPTSMFLLSLGMLLGFGMYKKQARCHC